MYNLNFLENKTEFSEELKEIIHFAFQFAFEETKTILNINKLEVLFINKDLSKNNELFFSSIEGDGSLYVFTDIKEIEKLLKSKKLEKLKTDLNEQIYNGLYRIARLNRCQLLLDCDTKEEIISEGLAAHFVIQLLGGKPKEYHTLTTLEEAEKLFKEIIDKDNFEKYLLGDGDIKRRTGISVAYRVVGNYLDKTKQTSVSVLDVLAKDMSIFN